MANNGDDEPSAKLEKALECVIERILTKLLKPKSIVNNVTNIINVSGQVGVLNTGEMRDIEQLTISVSKLNDAGASMVADALAVLTQAVLDSKDLASDAMREELLQQLKSLATQATLSPDQREKGVIKAVLLTVAATFSGAGGLAKVWDTWGPAIKTFFGI